VIDALAYAPGPILREVRVSGSIVMDTDKGVAAARETLWIDDVTPMLRAFARWRAWTVCDKWNPPPIVLKYLREGLEIDRDAARDAQSTHLDRMVAEFREGRREWIWE
jgi:hypothetical protein